MAYTATVTKDTKHAERISRNLGLLSGKCSISSYDQTGAEITDITGQFKSLKRCIVDGFSSNGYMVRWNTTDKCFHAYYPRPSDTPAGTVSQPTFTGSALAAHGHKALTVNASEVAADATAFVSITEGDGTAQAGIKVANAGGGVDTDINTDNVSAGTPSGTVSQPTFTGTAATAAPGTEVADGVDVGEINFIAIGLI